ncbi:hypothetical protein ACNS7O_04670 [Haloferacaceae archaeon DSL9]
MSPDYYESFLSPSNLDADACAQIADKLGVSPARLFPQVFDEPVHPQRQSRPGGPGGKAGPNYNDDHDQIVAAAYNRARELNEPQIARYLEEKHGVHGDQPMSTHREGRTNVPDGDRNADEQRPKRDRKRPQ